MLNQIERWRTMALAGVLAASAAGLSGCGFAPLYAQSGVAPGLTALDVVAPEGRAGFLLREQLDDALARNRAAPAAYRMDLAVRQEQALHRHVFGD